MKMRLATPKGKISRRINHGVYGVNLSKETIYIEVDITVSMETAQSIRYLMLDWNRTGKKPNR